MPLPTRSHLLILIRLHLAYYAKLSLHNNEKNYSDTLTNVGRVVEISTQVRVTLQENDLSQVEVMTCYFNTASNEYQLKSLIYISSDIN